MLVRRYATGVLIVSVLPWFRQLLADHSPRRAALNTGAVHIRFAAANVALGQISIGVRRFSSISTILTFLFIHSSITGAT